MSHGADKTIMNIAKFLPHFMAVCLLMASIILGGEFGARSWDGEVYVSETSFLSNSRSLANVPRNQSFVQLHMITEPSTRLISAAEVILHDGDIGIELGHFVMPRNEEGQRQLACDYYDRVSMHFTAEGIADNGVKPYMEVEAPCKSGTDINKIDTVWIPVQRILREESPNDKDITFDSVDLRFVHMTSQWPKHWHLEAIRLYNEQEPGRDYRLSDREIISLRKKPLNLTW
jgi:hypothetical protein